MSQKTLIHEVVGSSPLSGISAPQINGLDDSATGIGQANRFQLKSDLGKFQSRLLHESIAPPALMCWCQNFLGLELSSLYTQRWEDISLAPKTPTSSEAIIIILSSLLP